MRITPIVLSGLLFAVCAFGSRSSWAQDLDGAKLYQQYACSICHGVEGDASIVGYPNLAGLDGGYLAIQVNDIISGKRHGRPDGMGTPLSEIMRSALLGDDKQTPNLSHDEIRAITAWLTQQPPAKPKPLDIIKADELRAGAKLFRRYMCAACHGKAGKAPRKGYPLLAGQNVQYLINQLLDFKARERTNSGSPVMLSVVQRGSEQDMILIAKYLSQVPVTSP